MIKTNLCFDERILKQFINKEMSSYSHSQFVFNNAVPINVGFTIDGKDYELTNDFYAMDFMGMDDEVCVFKLEENTYVNQLDNIPTCVNKVNQKIESIQLINDEYICRINNVIKYDYKETRAILFKLNDGLEISFEKESTYFSNEILVNRGHDLINTIIDSNKIFDEDDNCNGRLIEVKREIVNI